MITERAEGYAIDETQITGVHLNQIAEKFKQEIDRKKELAKQIAFHRFIVEKPFRGKRAPGYISFSYHNGPSKSLFGN